MTETEEPEPSSLTVLVADDDPSVRRFLRSILEDDGYDVVEAANGDLTLSILQSRRVDAVLLDLNMPGTSGREVLRLLGPPHPLVPGPPVLVVSGEDEPDSVVKELREGAHDYIRKPFHANELLARLGAAVRMGVVRRQFEARMAELEALACTDPLTGLPNRRELMRAVQQAESDARRHREFYSAVMFDVDRFKEINDQHGHPRGDEVLFEVAQVLRRFTRASDTAGRWGGDEFLIVLPRGDAEAALAVAHRIRADVERAPWDVAVTVSAGVGVGPDPADVSVVDRADGALLAAKKAGRNRVEVAG